MRRQTVLPGLWRLTAHGVNAYALTTADPVTLIDAGTPACAVPLRRAIEALGPLGHIVVTHAHYDHAGGAAALAAATGATVWAHPDEADLIALGWTAPNGADVVFAGDTAMTQIGLSEPILYEDRQAGLASIARLAALAEGAHRVLFGHGPTLRRPGPALQAFSERLRSAP